MHSFTNLTTPSVPIPSCVPTNNVRCFMHRADVLSVHTKPNFQICPKNPIFFTFHEKPSCFLKISSTLTKPSPQYCTKNPIFFTSMQNSSTPTKPNFQICPKNPIFCTSMQNSSTPTKPKFQNCPKNPIFLSSRTKRFDIFSVSCLVMEEAPLEKLSVIDKVKCLALEFKSLKEPIDRVKRLLHYANMLPPLNESVKVKENRVMGCTTQVWLDVRMDKMGSMRFRVDSDSEITKGFCSCLIWLLDGAEPEEIMSVTAEDLADMNVGLPHGRSRVNTWHNVLFSMQNRTHDCVQERERERALSLADFRSLVVMPHGFDGGNGSYLESEPKCSLEVRQFFPTMHLSRLPSHRLSGAIHRLCTCCIALNAGYNTQNDYRDKWKNHAMRGNIVIFQFSVGLSAKKE